MGTMRARARAAEQAEEFWRRSLKIQQELARTHPANVSYRAAVADVNTNLGTLALFELNRPESALIALRDASDVYERLVHDYPETLYYSYNLLIAWQSLATVYGHLLLAALALALADQVLAHIDASTPQDRRDDNFRALYVAWLGIRAAALRRLDRPGEALQVCEQAIQLANDEKRLDWEKFREVVAAFRLLQEGEPRRAVESGGQLLAGLPPGHGPTLCSRRRPQRAGSGPDHLIQHARPRCRTPGGDTIRQTPSSVCGRLTSSGRAFPSPIPA